MYLPRDCIASLIGCFMRNKMLLRRKIQHFPALQSVTLEFNSSVFLRKLTCSFTGTLLVIALLVSVWLIGQGTLCRRQASFYSNAFHTALSLSASARS